MAFIEDPTGEASMGFAGSNLRDVNRFLMLEKAKRRRMWLRCQSEE